MRIRRAAAVALLGALALAAPGCGSGDDGPTATSPVPAVRDAPPTSTVEATGGERRALVATLGDSISAGYPGYDPDPELRPALPGGGDDERSQWQYWAARALPGVAFRNCGVSGERTDEIAQRLEACVRGADALVVQGGANDIAQDRPTASAADDIRSIVERAKAIGVPVLIAEVLPANTGVSETVTLIDDLNRRLAALADAAGVPLVPWYPVLEDPATPDRLLPAYTGDGVHPTVEGHRLLGEALAPVLAQQLG